MVNIKTVLKAMGKARSVRRGTEYITAENLSAGFAAFNKRQAIRAERRLKRTIEKQYAA